MIPIQEGYLTNSKQKLNLFSIKQGIMIRFIKELTWTVICDKTEKGSKVIYSF